LKFQAVAEKTAKDGRGLLYFAAPGTVSIKTPAVNFFATTFANPDRFPWFLHQVNENRTVQLTASKHLASPHSACASTVRYHIQSENCTVSHQQ